MLYVNGSSHIGTYPGRTGRSSNTAHDYTTTDSLVWSGEAVKANGMSNKFNSVHSALGLDFNCGNSRKHMRYVSNPL